MHVQVFLKCHDLKFASSLAQHVVAVPVIICNLNKMDSSNLENKGKLSLKKHQ